MGDRKIRTTIQTKKNAAFYDSNRAAVAAVIYALCSSVNCLSMLDLIVGMCLEIVRFAFFLAHQIHS